MIITVTLNAAIDKSLSVPNFRLGRRHRTVEQTTMAGGKGVNVARTLKTLGQPVIATGFAGGPTGTRIVEQLTDESILNDFVRIREESRTNTAVYDPTNGEQTEINERGPAVSATEIELFRDKLLYLARGADIVVFAGSLPRGVDPDIYAEPDPRAAQARASRRSSTPTASRCATPCAPSPTSSRRTSSRPRSSSATSSTTTRTASIAVREMVALGAREAIMTLPDGCVACVLVDGEPTLHRVLDRAARGRRRRRRRRRVPGRLRRRPLRRARTPERVPALRRRLRRGVDRSASAPGSSTRARSSGCWARSRSQPALGRRPRSR